MVDVDDVEKIEIGNRQHIMEVDKIIIDAVRQQPCLYISNFNMEQRKRGWKQLSEKLKIKELHLRIRWHLLVQRYQSDEKFKYAQQMDFVERIKKSKEDSRKWPEFEITEEDVMERSSNSEEYVFLEVEDMQDNNMVKASTTVKEEKIDENNDSSNDCKNYPPVPSPAESINNAPGLCEANTNESNFTIKRVESAEQVQKPCREPICNKENVGAQPEQHANSAPTKASSTERCEDDIFGELVSAMIKRMDPDKKRLVKKEIMNVLLA